MPLNQVASVAAPEPKLLTVQPWDKSLLKAVEKAIQASDLGLNPANDGSIIRIPVPALTHVSDDEKKHGEKDVQKLHDEHMKLVDEVVKHKEAEIMEV
jgi:ribosome recycling factor